MIICSTPATLAGTIFISTEEDTPPCPPARTRLPGPEGSPAVPDFSGGVCIKPSVPALFFMEGTDINQRLSHYLQQSGIHLFVGFLHFFLCHKDGSAIQLYAVKAGGIVKQGPDPPPLSPAPHIRHSFFILSVAVRASLQQIFQNILSGFLRQFYVAGASFPKWARSPSYLPPLIRGFPTP